jgi:DNA-binding IclR family transcriptional regulator
MVDGKPSYVIQSVSRALRILDELGRIPRGATAQQLARRCELPIGTTYHFLRTLCYEGYVMHRPGGRYVLGVKIADRFCDFLEAIERPPAVHDVLRHLAGLTGYSAYWGQLVNGRIVITDLSEGPRSPHVEDLMVGFDLAAHATAMGKALLSCLPGGRRAAYLQEQGLRPFTRNTVLEAEAVEHDIRAGARRGLFVEYGQYRDDLCCAAVVVPAYSGASIGFCGGMDTWEHHGPALLRTLRVAARDFIPGSEGTSER